VPAAVTSMTPRRAGGPRSTSDPQPPRRRFRDSPRLILVGIAVLAAFLAAMLLAASRLRFAPELFTEVVLYALIAVDLTMLAALAFVLARNLIKVIVERNRALPFARFRSKLVAVLMAMTVVPAVLVLIVGSELISQNLERWFNAPMDDILSSANQIASDYYRERQVLVGDQAQRIARSIADAGLAKGDEQPLREMLNAELASQQVSRVAVYGVEANGALSTSAVDAAAPNVPSSFNHRVVDRLAAQTLAGSGDSHATESIDGAGDLLHAAAVIRPAHGRVEGVVVATDYLTGGVVARSRRMTQAFESYSQLRVLKRPLTGLYLSFFLMVTLFILVGSLWMGSYLAKRITRPVSALAAAAKEIGAGHLDQRVEPQSNDEFGLLVDAFNTMAGELATSRRRVERSTLELERKHVEVENRRRYIETILERITTGIVSVDADGLVTTINSAASRLLTLDGAVVGRPARAVFDRADLQPLGALLSDGGGKKAESAVREIPVLHDGQELQLAVVTTTLVGDSGAPAGLLLVLDDVTPLIRAQKVAAWREVARRLAHEIKNPLTPIQLSAERMRRQFAGRPAADRALVDECAATIVGEVESLKGLVDEFSQFARMPSPRTVPTDVAALIGEALGLYEGIFADVSIVTRFAPDLPLVRIDVEQIRRVVINLVDNAIEAMERKGEIVVETALDEANRVVRIVIADNGPGIPASERDKLFLPYYSTKRRGSGLGLAIVRRVIAEHGGSIEVGDNTPHGTRFTIELPS
jgi:two-component system, NtrC family, nitrogen regulation sensor histidine kinase NtrY